MQPVLVIQVPDSLRQLFALSAVFLMFLHLAVLFEGLGVAYETHIWALFVSVKMPSQVKLKTGSPFKDTNAQLATERIGFVFQFSLGKVIVVFLYLCHSTCCLFIETLFSVVRAVL